MSAWKTVALGDVCDVTAGGTPSRSSAECFGGSIPWVKIGDMLQGTITETEESITRSGLKGSAAKLLPRGTVLISIFATIGRTAVLGVEAATNQAIAGITPRDPSILTPAYLRRYLDSVVSTLERRARGVAQVNINSGILRGLPVPVPPLPEQRRIAEILDKADALRAKRRAALAQLDTLTQSIFLDMFGDPATNPKGFPIAQMGDVCDVRDGTHDSPKYVSEGGYPLVTSKNVTGGVVDLTDANYISEADYVQINRRSKVDRGDIILPMIGTIGSPVLVDHEPHYAIKNVALIKFTNKSPSAVLVRHLLSGQYFDYIVSQKNRGGTQKFVSLGDLRAFPLPLPPKDVQLEFARRIEMAENIRTTFRASDAELNALFASLQYRAFGGDL